jgi:hypothetical protein
MPHRLSEVQKIAIRHSKKIRDVELHKHLQKVRDDLAAGRPVWIPKQK